jgi:lipoprotein-releasing system permease protein
MNKYEPLSIVTPVHVETWEEKQAAFLGAVQKELVLVVFLFSIISLVAVFLVFCIFFMIVVEKTKDIGIIKSVGATSGGVAAVFLGYGLAIGIIGAALGLLASYLIVHNINFLHAKMGELIGVKIWDEKTYAFDTIPNTMNPRDVVWIVIIAILSCIVGALVPAIRAARMNPVESLRWE